MMQESYPKILKSREGPLESLSKYKQKKEVAQSDFFWTVAVWGETRTAEDSMATKRIKANAHNKQPTLSQFLEVTCII